MSTSLDEEEMDIPGEGGPVTELGGEGAGTALQDNQPPPFVEDIIVERSLSFEEASKCLHTLGKDESGIRYAYIMMSPTDRKLTEVKIIMNFKHVMFLDLSGNYLETEALHGIMDMPYLVSLKADRNRLETADFKPMKFLQALSLNRNLISETSNINQPNLGTLELAYNAIQFADFQRSNLPNVTQLDLRGNYFTSLVGLYPPNLENLYMADNKIRRLNLATMGRFTCLRKLHLRNNAIRKLDGFTSKLVNLDYLNLRENNISKFREFRKLQCLPSLDTLVIIHNPVAGEEMPKSDIGGEDAEDEEEVDEEEGEANLDTSRLAVIMFLPRLKRLNKADVSMAEREGAVLYREEKYDEIMAEESDVDVFDDDENATSTEADYSENLAEVEEQSERDSESHTEG